MERLSRIKEFSSQKKVSKPHSEYLATLEKEVDLHIENFSSEIPGPLNPRPQGYEFKKVVINSMFTGLSGHRKLKNRC
jgi:hypothetical protein